MRLLKADLKHFVTNLFYISYQDDVKVLQKITNPQTYSKFLRPHHKGNDSKFIQSPEPLLLCVARERVLVLTKGVATFN